MSRGRVRVSIDSVPLVIQPNEEDVARFAAERPGEWLTAATGTAEDRAAGRQRFEVVVDGWLFEVVTESAGRAELRERVARDAADHRSSARLTLRAQIPGRVVRVWVEEGDTVERGQRLLAIEAMKMENEIRAPQPGTVSGLRVALGDRVERQDELLSVS